MCHVRPVAGAGAAQLPVTPEPVLHAVADGQPPAGVAPAAA
ncbi:hypothetical protein [Spirilliplanes yamanashiensis]|nr:hypothetical protein [Spirilliplanes yamanashiensis]MDP9818762.1 hypothetical protein [Spirilliplanes yamanashiensis]